MKPSAKIDYHTPGYQRDYKRGIYACIFPAHPFVKSTHCRRCFTEYVRRWRAGQRGSGR